MSVGEQEVGLCLDCLLVVDINEGKVVGKGAASTWMQMHPEETALYNLKGEPYE
jgi:hypothetical protein